MKYAPRFFVFYTIIIEINMFIYDIYRNFRVYPESGRY